ncbi:glycoprotein-N-acetylgalactosamine 3-beta-galactosyltransferase 1-like [Biomphalaria glabrata]|uniref:Glycoprotein-N-acetylgalactosamine 3-beta-galactosyltransferase 1 n=1 Tax=Biomphalaria glabrata TaxID=6526 RepID=A0A9U8EBE2_BIOGL|nr:glycoprotein-N-acetylgalactosamine 3-beta-galactosyltransferase 1-like [Biomphalaria glabrata]
MVRLRNLQFCLGVTVGISATFTVLVMRWSWTSIPDTGQESHFKRGTSNNSCPCSSVTDDYNIAQELFQKVRIVCWIMTSPTNLQSRAIHVKNTWTKRCNVVLFMSSVQNASFPTIGLNVSEGRSHLTAKTMKAFKYLYDNHLEDADWFLKADDDTYVIMENLRYLLSEENPKEAIYFGARFKAYVKQGYTSGGGGYVISKEALRRIGSEGFLDKRVCTVDGGPEDVQIGLCLQNLGVRLKPSLDVRGRTRFHCFKPEDVVTAKFPKWYYNFDFDHGKGGMDNISDYAISFHYVKGDTMYALEYFIYHLRPYGIPNRAQTLNVQT